MKMYFSSQSTFVVFVSFWARGVGVATAAAPFCRAVFTPLLGVGLVSFSASFVGLDV
jgi:hypothetical protein